MTSTTLPSTPTRRPSWQSVEPDFIPHAWLNGPHLQTVLAAYLWRRRPESSARHVVSLPDGDNIVLHDDCPPNWQHQRTALLLHGLAGCHQSGYMQRTAAKLKSAGVRVLRLDLRGCGAGRLLARRSVHAGRTADLQAAVEAAIALCPTARLTVVGFSLGASIVLKWLGRCAAHVPAAVDAAIAVAPPLDLAVCAQQLQLGWSRLYDRNFVRLLGRQLAARRRALPSVIGPTVTSSPRSLYEFDAWFTAPMGEFADVDTYYRDSSSWPDLAQIRVPTRILFALDDPLIPSALFANATFSAATQVYATRHGGHLGYLADRAATRSADPDWHWLDWRVVDWIVASSP